MKKILLTLMILALLMPIGCVYAWGGGDNSDRLSNDQAGVFSPGYLNAAKQQAYNVVNQNNKSKGWWEKLVDNVKNKVSDNIEEDANTKVQPEVKKKTSAKSETTLKRQLTTEDQVTIPPGMGTDKTYNEDGRLISEVFDGQRYVYAGFANVGIDSIQGAINWARIEVIENRASTIIVAVKAGEYSIDISSNLYLKSGVSLYGGYDESGVRSIKTSTLSGSGMIMAENVSDCEINGFTLDNGDGGNDLIQLWGSTNITIINNTFSSSVDRNVGMGVSSYTADNTHIVNNVFNTDIFMLGRAGTGVNDTFISGNIFNSYAGVWIGGETYSSGNNYNGRLGLTTPNDFFYGEITSEGDYFGAYTRNRGALTVTAISPNSFAQNLDSANSALTVNQNPIITTITRDVTVSSSRDTTTANNPLTTENKIFAKFSYNSMSQDSLSGIFKGLSSNKNVLRSNMAIPLNEAVVGRLVTDSLASAVGVPSLMATEGRIPEMQIAMALANILRNPTGDQKAILDVIESLLADMNNINEKAGANPELNKAESDLLQMVAAVLLAQGVPDLLKAGDIEGVKGIFKDLGQSKDKIMMDYTKSIKPYYSNIVKELTANLALLQLNGMLSKKITEKELKELEPREIDKILEAIRKANNKTFELEYILQQDTKYRKEYLDPQNKTLEEAMKIMLNGFTQRISKALEDKK